MIHYIKGVITENAPGMVCLECGGIGYEINVPDGAVRVLPGSMEETLLYTALIVREDDMSLYGFPGKDWLYMFRLLIGVSGVGPKAALALLSVMNPDELKKAIFFEDASALCRANGVGKKGAQRIVMELKDKVGVPGELSAAEPSKGAVSPASSDERSQAVSALMALGFTRTEAASSVMAIAADDLSAGEYIKLALKQKR